MKPEDRGLMSRCYQPALNLAVVRPLERPIVRLETHPADCF
jgi:hypothetical protein